MTVKIFTWDCVLIFTASKIQIDMDTKLSAAVNEKLDQQFLLLLSDAEAILKEDALARSKSTFFDKVKVKQSEMSIKCFT